MADEYPLTTPPGRTHRPDEPFGWWPSPWPASRVAAGKVSRSGLQADGQRICWSESRPGEGGRQVVVATSGHGGTEDLSPPGVSVRSRVHEYGGAAATVVEGVLFYVDQADQRWYRAETGDRSGPQPLTPEWTEEGVSVRYADGRLTQSGRWLVSVEERVSPGSVEHRLVAVDLVAVETYRAQPRPPVPLVDRGDFVTSPRVSPDGRWLAWVTWDHPSMPWDSSELWMGRLVETDEDLTADDVTNEHLTGGGLTVENDRRVAGGPGVSVGQVQWCRDGSLLFVDDRTGWWLPYRLPIGETEPAALLVDRTADFHAPDWVLGQSTMAELSDGSIVCRMHGSGRDELVRLDPPDPSDGPGWSVGIIDQPCLSISGVVVIPATDSTAAAADADADADADSTATDSTATDSTVPRPGPEIGPDRVFLLGSTATEAHGIVEVSLSGELPARRVSAEPEVVVAGSQVSRARRFIADTPAGPIPGLLFVPVRAPVELHRSSGDGDEAGAVLEGRPPLVVFCHGGPTSAAEPGFDPLVQFFTSRGLAVAIVDYRGSSGYGRAYRRRLDGLWGEADVDDCVGYAAALAEAGEVDGARMAIRGTSAGGLTALAALIRARRFAGATAWYGVTDLEALATDTHDFESRYVDSLVGPWPEAADTYRSRSPIHHADQVVGEVLLLQGAEDPVVPPDQSERFAATLERCGIPYRLIVFPGESHGFRQAATIEASLEAELDFYRSLFDRPVVGSTAVPPQADR